jgi:DNA primase
LTRLEQSDWLVMDLDPEDVDFDAVMQTAQTVRQVLDEAGVAVSTPLRW